MTGPARSAAVVIGRNEGARLVRCLAALEGEVGTVIYVDSGSTDNSVAVAQAAGADVVALDMDQPFTAARARNAGLARLRAAPTPPDYVQFVDGDCEMQPGWVAHAVAFLQDTPKAAVAAGRVRERFPEASVYNFLADQEWNTPIGETRACGGIALMRMTALNQVTGFNPDLIAGEEPELCVRLREQGWSIWRLDAEMTLHDAAMTRFAQWWTRARRGGYAAAQGAAMHGGAPERHKVHETKRALIWGALIPLIGVLGAVLIHPGVLLIWLIFPVQVLRLWRRGMDWRQAGFLTLSKLPEALGVLTYLWRRATGAQPRLIEYK